tara:strand:- start:929 stop:1300 length:372 start_codon:yes stop_codon:yes gene_type:complete
MPNDALKPSAKRDAYLRLSSIIMRSKIYTQGGSFTASDLMSKIRIKAPEAQELLSRMVDDGYLMEVTRGSGCGPITTAYAQKSAVRALTNRRLAYYVPPTPERVRHYNSWLRSAVAYELGNVG